MMNINTVISDLNLISASLDAQKSLQDVLNLFANKHIPGIIINREKQFFRIISRSWFHEMMSKQYMLELFSKRKIISFFEDEPEQEILILPGNTPVAIASSRALSRSEYCRFDPIVIQLISGELKILDFFNLLIAQTEIHLLTLEFLKEANEFKKEIMGIAAHDLRNPLNAVLGFSKIIQETEDTCSEISGYAGFIYESASQMNNLITDLLHSAVADLTGMVIEKKSFDLGNLLKDIINKFKLDATDKNQSIIFCNFNSNIFRIEADFIKVSEIFENLISNAIKYTPPGKSIFIRINITENFYCIDIEDEGLGFTEDDLKKVFMKFQKLSAQPTGGETSNGLGLYIVHKYVELHKGTISVKSQKNIGSTITVKLPVY